MQGINDNGSGSIALLELALNLRKYSFNNAVRFAWFAAEEQGLIGSYQYVSKLSNMELSKIALYLNFDMIGSPNAGHFVFDPDCSNAEDPAQCPPAGVAHIRDTFQQYYSASAGVPTQTTDDYGLSDYQAFLDAGIPAGYLSTGVDAIITPAQALLYVLCLVTELSHLLTNKIRRWGTTAGDPFDPCWHKACDTINNLNVNALVITTKGAAYALATYANSVAGLGRVTSPLRGPFQRRSLFSSKVRRGDGPHIRSRRHRW